MISSTLHPTNNTLHIFLFHPLPSSSRSHQNDLCFLLSDYLALERKQIDKSENEYGLIYLDELIEGT